ncbi:MULTISPECIES: Pycsar system effector family protein [unclassified Sphingomonas]|uniref:Pycsar system effector family protein n=1 Tax=Sphingomonas sp. PvP015 TaxID=3156388 RepID=UPI00339A4EDA
MQASNPIPTEALERQLDRLLTFFPRIDSKVSALFAVTSAQLAVAALNLTLNDLKVWWITGCLVAFALCALWVMIHLYRCAYPHLEGGQQSLIYFAEIVKKQSHAYVRSIDSVKGEVFREDLAGQIYRNAEILCLKYRFLKRATVGASVSTLPWVALLLATSLSHWKMPVFSS